ncbi:uncharacterized protein LOC120359992 [Solenopsis invicta]|uniref:uncharacterized protein LOC120359992 n=1 Tax=Solenopsis invicta TaxID=13686 RepID=UPI00193E9B2A|nr:uncharacterized protein LOC120359992 [Solenopsis invicta]
MYKLHGAWFRLTPKPIEVLAPPIIQPLTHPTWHYASPSSLATSGIYSDEDLDRLRAHIMFPVEKPSMLNTIARGALGETIPSGSVSMYNLLDEDSLNRIAESAGERVWHGFVTFGSASAGILAIFIIARIVKLIIDTIIHDYALHSIYGWSMHLLGAIWSSVTHLLIHLGGRKNQASATTPEARPTPEDAPSLTLSMSEARLPKPQGECAKSERLKPTYTYAELRKYVENNCHGTNESV